MSSRIEQIIGEIEEYVDSCKFQPLSTTKIVVNKEEIEDACELFKVTMYPYFKDLCDEYRKV